MNILETIAGVQSEHDAEIVVSSGDTVTVKLTTDGNTAATEEFFVNVIAGRDAGVCPTTDLTISALDSPQFLTSNNFPDNYANNEECDLVITADEGKVVNYTFEFIHTESREDCFDPLQVINGLPRLYDLFDVCNPFLPTVAGVSDGRNLRI
ncbi:uncharacterized protein LOC111137498 isoform X1 [Crassostrea virginica]